MLPKDRGENKRLGAATGGIHPAAPISPRAPLFSVRADLHPPPGESDLTDWLTDARCAFAELYGETITGFPTDRRHLAKVLRRRAGMARAYARFAEQAASVADAIADREDV